MFYFFLLLGFVSFSAGCEGEWEKSLPFEPFHIRITMSTPEASSPEISQPPVEQPSQQPEVQDLEPAKEMQWSVYANQKNKFSLSYPEGWTALESQNGDVVSFKVQGREDIRFLVIASVSPETTPTADKLASRRQQERRALFPGLVVVSEGPVGVRGGYALKKTWKYMESNKEISYSGAVRETAVFLVKDQTEYTIYATASKGITGAAEVYFVKMIQSFNLL